jgi:monofunctional biosynthetic peptidoglycan transglycosylase
MPMNNGQTVFNFADPAAVQGWRAIDDRIMGGCSLSRAEFVEGGGLRFRGVVSVDNGGGFASIRSPEAAYDLGDGTGLRLRVRGDGKHYQLGLRTDRFFDGISYQAGFFTESGGWLEIDLPFAGFVPTHHGRLLTNAAPLDPARIQSFGLFIAERQAGPFQLEVAEIFLMFS